MHSEALLDGDQVTVIIAEQRAQEIGLVELARSTVLLNSILLTITSCSSTNLFYRW